VSGAFRVDGQRPGQVAMPVTAMPVPAASRVRQVANGTIAGVDDMSDDSWAEF